MKGVLFLLTQKEQSGFWDIVTRYTVLKKGVDCKSEHHIFEVKMGLRPDVHFCNRVYNSFGHDLRKAGKHEPNDINRESED